MSTTTESTTTNSVSQDTPTTSVAAAAATSESSSSTPTNFDFEKWDDIEDLNMKLLRGIYAYGYEDPSPIQKKAILPMIHGRDVIGQAQSGTGKTGAFCVGTLQNMDPKLNETQAIILSPTHELARQNKDVCESLGSFMKMRLHLLIGGSSVEEDKSILTGSKKPHIVVGCPGRVFDMMRRGWLSTEHVKVFVLDEADEMLSSCFKEQVYNILQFVNNNVQIGLFSATLPDDVKELASKFMHDPVSILVKSAMLTLDGIKQYYVALNDDHQKYETLKDLFHNVTFSQTIIYCNSVKRVQELTDAMLQDSFPVTCIHSSMTRDERKKAIQMFKSGESRVLISSDVTARGIDVQQVSVVINFDLCKNKHTYLHRSGRSGRWGRKGVAINLITRRDTFAMKEIEEWYQTQIEELPSDYATKIQG
jgi:translation initiation factor 4A